MSSSTGTARPRSIEPQPTTSLAAKPAIATIGTAPLQVSTASPPVTPFVQTSPRRPRAEPLVATDITPAAIAQPNVSTPTIQPNTPLDMGRHGWPQAMIERIEALRDAADAIDTSIRIIPDKLGTIDISVRREGELTHVHFAAEQAQTRTILADAQPRLAELADARGLRLGQSSIDGGDGQHQSQNPRPQSAFVPAAPARAPRRDEGAATDHRIA